jgi:hypothetical protein
LNNPNLGLRAVGFTSTQNLILSTKKQPFLLSLSNSLVALAPLGQTKASHANATAITVAVKDRGRGPKVHHLIQIPHAIAAQSKFGIMMGRLVTPNTIYCRRQYPNNPFMLGFRQRQAPQEHIQQNAVVISQ